MDGGSGLGGPDIGWVRESIGREQRTVAQGAVGGSRIDEHLVLPLECDERPFSGGVKIQMPDLIAEAPIGSDRQQVGEDAVFKTENLEGAGIFRFGRGGSVATSEQHDGSAGWIDAYLVPIDAEVE